MGSKKTINFILLDGTTDGRIECTVSFKDSLCAFKLSRTQVAGKNDDIKELNNSGIYFLFGPAETAGKDASFYIGQAGVRKNNKGLLQRINESHKPIEGWNWKTAIIFTTNNGSLDSSQLNYLENMFYKATNTKRVDLKNNKEPSKGSINPSSKISADDFSEAAKVITSFWGYKVFDLVVKSDIKTNQTEKFYFAKNAGKPNECNAEMRTVDDKFIVLKGAKLSPDVKKFLDHDNMKIRKLQAKNISSKYVTLDDITFSSPSAAASFVSGGSENGRIVWKNISGITVADFLDKNK